MKLRRTLTQILTTHTLCPVCLTRNGSLSRDYGCCRSCEDADYRAYCAFEDARYQDRSYLGQRYLDTRDDHPDEMEATA